MPSRDSSRSATLRGWVKTRPEQMWDRFIEHYAKKYGFVDGSGKRTMVSFIGGIEHYRKEFIEAQQGE